MFDKKLFQTTLNGLTLFMMLWLSYQLAKSITTTQQQIVTVERIIKHNNDTITKNGDVISKIADLAKHNGQMIKDHDEAMVLARDGYKEVKQMRTENSQKLDELKSKVETLEKRVK